MGTNGGTPTAGDSINAQGSRGFINRPEGDVVQIFGDIHQGDSADRIIEKLQEAGVLTHLITRLPEPTIRRLLEIVSHIDSPDAGVLVRRACRDSLPTTAHLINSEVPSALLLDMCEQQLSKDWLPVFECVERLAAGDGIDAAVARELRAWVDAYASTAIPALAAVQVEQLRREIRVAPARSGAPGYAWLQVYLDPDRLNRTKQRKVPLFRVEFVLWSPGSSEAVTLPQPVLDEVGVSGDDRLWDLKELPAALDQVVRDPDTLARVSDTTRLIIEVVAPAEFILYGFERWTYFQSNARYGQYHPLVVRLQDRLLIPNAFLQRTAGDLWRRKWNVFRNHVCQGGCEHMEWRRREELDALELRNDVGIVCLGISSPVRPGQQDVFDTLRDAGMPVALLLRGEVPGWVPPADWREQFLRSIRGEPLMHLHERVMSIRSSREVRNDAAHFGNALTLLWDDPERSPRKYDVQGVFV